MGDLKDMQGFDPNQSLAMDQTMDGGAPMGDIPTFDDRPGRFEQNNDFGMQGGIQRSNSLSGQRPPVQDNNNLMGAQQQNQNQF
jgi:hypothetical protein